MKSPLLLFSLIGITLCAQAQSKFGIKAGLNASIFSASINSESSFTTGFHLGCYGKIPVSSRISFRPEIYYSSQGQKDNYQNQPNGPSIGKTTTTMNYVNVPLLFEFGRKVSFQFGPQFGVLVSANEKGTISNAPVDDDLKDVMKSVDFSAVFGLGFSPAEHFNFGVRYNLGLTDVYTADDDSNLPGLSFPDVKNRVFHFYLGYSF